MHLRPRMSVMRLEEQQRRQHNKLRNNCWPGFNDFYAKFATMTVFCCNSRKCTDDHANALQSDDALVQENTCE